VVVVSNAPARLVLDIYSSAFGYLDTVAAPAWVTCSIRWNGIDTASFALESDDRLNALLGVPGRRMVVRYRPEALLPDTVDLLSGAIYTQQGDADPRSSVRTYHVSGDFCLLDQLLGWPNPTGTISQQGDDEAFYEATGPAETAALSLINLNRARSVTPITVAASGGRGSSVAIRVRMHKLADKLFPVVGNAGVGIRLLQGDTSVVASGYVGTVQDDVLTQQDGVVASGGWVLTPPTATRVAVGGPGEGTARVWRYVTDPALEAAWGRSWEVQVDARDLKEDDPALASKMDARGHEALAEGAPKVSVSAELSETEDFQFIKRYNLGDLWPVQFVDYPEPIVDRITRIDISETADDGLKITPYLGTMEDSTEAQLVKAVSNIARSVRDMKART